MASLEEKNKRSGARGVCYLAIENGVLFAKCTFIDRVIEKFLKNNFKLFHNYFEFMIVFQFNNKLIKLPI